MRTTETRDHSPLIAHHGTIVGHQEPVVPARPARCTSTTYGGDVVTVEGVVKFRGRGEDRRPLLAFSAIYPGWGEWTAWVDAESCTPLDA